jgi:hypothetical protein
MVVSLVCCFVTTAGTPIEFNRVGLRLKIHTHSSCKRFAHWTPSVTLYEARRDQTSYADIRM